MAGPQAATRDPRKSKAGNQEINGRGLGPRKSIARFKGWAPGSSTSMSGLQEIRRKDTKDRQDTNGWLGPRKWESMANELLGPWISIIMVPDSLAVIVQFARQQICRQFILWRQRQNSESFGSATI